MTSQPVAIRLEHAEAIPLAVVRRHAPPSELGAVVQQGCGLVWAFVRARSVHAGRHVAVYLNGSIDVEVGIEVSGSFAEDGNVVRSSTPAGMVATAIHFGPYQQLGAVHDAIRTWCAANGHRLTGLNWEIYGHWLAEWTANPSRIRTDVFYQIGGVEE